MKVVYLKIELRADLSDLGAPDSKFWDVMHSVGIGERVFSEVQEEASRTVQWTRGQLTLSMEYDAVVMQREMCIGRWDGSPPLSLM